MSEAWTIFRIDSDPDDEANRVEFERRPVVPEVKDDDADVVMRVEVTRRERGDREY